MSRSFDFSEADQATVAAVGEPGHRTFYIQVRQGDDLVTLKLEKQQVAAIAQFLGEILSDLPVPEDLPSDADLELVEPVVAEWVIGSLQLSYDSGTDRILVTAEEIGEPGEEEGGPPEPAGAAEATAAEQALGRFALTRAQAVALVKRGWDLVNAGRPTCPLCGHPIDPEGHSCPRTNGHRPPQL